MYLFVGVHRMQINANNYSLYFSFINRNHYHLSFPQLLLYKFVLNVTFSIISGKSMPIVYCWYAKEMLVNLLRQYSYTKCCGHIYEH